MQKVLHISKYYHPFVGGIEQVARDIVTSLEGSCEQKVICFNHESGNKKDIVDGVEINRVNCQCKVASQSIAFGYKKQLKKLIVEFNPDVVIFHYPNPFVAHYLLKLKKKGNFKLILYWHLDIVKQKILGKFFNGQNHKLLKLASKVVATSPDYVDTSVYLSQYKDKCVVIPCAFNDSRFDDKEAINKAATNIKNRNEGKLICFGFGRHVPYKGLDYLVRAAKLLDPDKYMVYIGGQGPMTEELRAMSEDHHNIVILGRLTDIELAGYLQACDIFCFPSITKNEAFGIGLVEGMSCGHPAVTFKIAGSGVNYVSIHNETGITVPNGDYEAYAKAIEKLGDNPELRQAFGNSARQRVLDNFTLEKFAEKINKLVKEI